jgi:ABC-type arginine/histidine transport system permease subunit
VQILSTISGLNPALELTAIVLLVGIFIVVIFSLKHQRSRRRSRRHYRTRVIYYC